MASSWAAEGVYLYAVDADVDGHKGDQALGQQLPDGLPHAAKAADDDVPAQLLHLALRGLQRLAPHSASCRLAPKTICPVKS